MIRAADSGGGGNSNARQYPGPASRMRTEDRESVLRYRQYHLHTGRGALMAKDQVYLRLATRKPTWALIC